MKRYVVTNYNCIADVYLDSEPMEYQAALEVCLEINKQAKRGLRAFSDLVEENCVKVGDYFYDVCGDNMPCVRFAKNDDAWEFFDTHLGYDCVVETLKQGGYYDKFSISQALL